MSIGKFVFVGIVILLLGAVYLGFYVSPTGNVVAQPDPTPVNVPTPTETTTSTPVATVEPTPEPAKEEAWYLITPGFENAEIGTYSTLFDTDVYAVKDTFQGGYNLFDVATGMHIGSHVNYDPSNFDPYERLHLDDAEYLEKFNLDKIIYEQNFESGMVALQIDNNTPVIIEAVEGRDDIEYYIGKAIYLKLI